MGEVRSGCGGAAPRKTKASRSCRAGGHGTVSLEEVKQRMTNAGRTWRGYRGDGLMESPGAHAPSPSEKKIQTKILIIRKSPHKLDRNTTQCVMIYNSR